jgi:hypothetical protein
MLDKLINSYKPTSITSLILKYMKGTLALLESLFTYIGNETEREYKIYTRTYMRMIFTKKLDFPLRRSPFSIGEEDEFGRFENNQRC